MTTGTIATTTSLRGEVRYISELETSGEAEKTRHVKLNQLLATSICGNDITSSCLYVSAICALYAGPYAPLSLLLVAGVLYLFRKVYGEVGTALPLNGGAYNVLLNTTSKKFASLAACLTILSYIATAVISAYEAMHYAHQIWHEMSVIPATILLLCLFAFLSILGISESAKVATGIFLFHITTLLLLVGACAVVVFQDTSRLMANFQQPPAIGVGPAVFFGFAAAMLGVSGFESSANFIEEQADGVFVKTLRNMWVAVASSTLLSVSSLWGSSRSTTSKLTKRRCWLIWDERVLCRSWGIWSASTPCWSSPGPSSLPLWECPAWFGE